MTTLIGRTIARLFVALSPLAALTMIASAQDSYEKSIQNWRAEREEKLKADEGWLTVSGLFWLREGVNDIGAAPTNDITLPPNSAPERIGSFEMNNGKVTLRIAEGVSVTVNPRMN
ncbi:MAG: hypothetical protein J2P21_26225 [Chloracidobacterium sp.]|nr:hypothetical protein [Chloracidobacterium sp.]